MGFVKWVIGAFFVVPLSVLGVGLVIAAPFSDMSPERAIGFAALGAAMVWGGYRTALWLRD